MGIIGRVNRVIQLAILDEENREHNITDEDVMYNLDEALRDVYNEAAKLSEEELNAFLEELKNERQYKGEYYAKAQQMLMDAKEKYPSKLSMQTNDEQLFMQNLINICRNKVDMLRKEMFYLQKITNEIGNDLVQSNEETNHIR